VTHGVVVLSLTGQSLAMSEFAVLKPEGCCTLKMVGRLSLQDLREAS
jgi:hypothetical protein